MTKYTNSMAKKYHKQSRYRSSKHLSKK